MTPTYIVPAILIFLGLFQTEITKTSVVAAAILTFPLYKAFSLAGKRFDFSHSCMQEFLYRRRLSFDRPVPYKLAFRILRRMIILEIFELLLGSIITASDYIRILVPDVKAFCGLLLLFYLTTDFIFVTYEIIFGQNAK